MPHASANIIRQEHRALSAMLRAILLMLGEHRRRDTLPDFAALRAMLFYVDEFPERLHHPKESRLLFPKLRGRDASTDAMLDRLEHDHAQGEHAIRDVEHALLALEMMGETDQRHARRDTFEALVGRYMQSWLAHMRTEETEVLPLAESVLGADDWAEIDAAFQSHRDPLTGFEAKVVYQALFRKILQALPPSGGIGGALEALAGTGPPKFAAQRP